MKKIIVLLLAALMLASCTCIGVFAAESEPIPTETQLPETESIETESPENDPLPPADQTEHEDHAVIIDNDLLDQGLVMPNRIKAKYGDVVILAAFEKEYEKEGVTYKKVVSSWYASENVKLIAVSKTMVFFFMPDSDVTVYPVFEDVDMTKYYYCGEVEDKISKLHRNENIEIDMKGETAIPKAVLMALEGKESEVTFVTSDCVFTIKGTELKVNTESEGGFSITYTDLTLTKAQRAKLTCRDILAVSPTVETDHSVIAYLHCFAAKDVTSGYLYGIDEFDLEYITAVSVENGKAVIPVTESRDYVLTTAILSNVNMSVEAASPNTVVIIGGKLVPLSAYADGRLYFRPSSTGKLMLSEYLNTYGDVAEHIYREKIDFVCARDLIDGYSAAEFRPDEGITTGQFMRAIARLRGIPDKDAYTYCTKLDIFTYEYVENKLLTRNEMSVIFTNFINHLIEYPESFGGYSMECFNGNAAAWVGDLFREIKADSEGEYDWKANATRAEAAYLLEAAVFAVVIGDR